MTSPGCACSLSPVRSPAQPAPRHPKASLDDKLQPDVAGASLRAGLGPSQGLGQSWLILPSPSIGCLGGERWGLSGDPCPS